MEEIIKFIQNGQLDNAEEYCLERLKTNPNDIKFLYYTGIVYMQKNQPNDAIKYFLQAYAIEEKPIITENLGLAYFLIKNYMKAIQYLERAISNNFDEGIVELLLKAYTETRDYNGLLKYYKLLHQKHPNEVMYTRKIAELASKLNDTEQAIEFYKKSLAIEPQDYIAHNNLGLIYENLEDYTAAKQHYIDSLLITNNYYANYNLGVLERYEHNFELSEQHLKAAIALAPEAEQTPTIYSLALTYFTEKNFEEGYKYFIAANIRPFTNSPIWQGDVQPDKTLLVHCQCGFGDYIQFCRYFNDLKTMFKEVKAYVPKELKDLFQANFPDIKLYTDDIPEHDLILFLYNAPYYLRFLNKDFNNIPYKNGYLKADAEKIEFYKDKFFNTSDKKIGICWVGGNLNARSMKNRRIELNYFKQFTKIPNTKFYIVSKDDPFDEIKDNPEFINIAQEATSFNDTATIMKNLDLVISIDSSPIHLAGALGVNARLILPYTSDWRWFCNTNECDWYDSVKIFKFKAQKNIDELTKVINNDINALFEN